MIFLEVFQEFKRKGRIGAVFYLKCYMGGGGRAHLYVCLTPDQTKTAKRDRKNRSCARSERVTVMGLYGMVSLEAKGLAFTEKKVMDGLSLGKRGGGGGNKLRESFNLLY